MSTMSKELKQDFAVLLVVLAIGIFIGMLIASSGIGEMKAIEHIYSAMY